MGGILLYLFTLILETISMVVRFALVYGLVALAAPPAVAVWAGAVAALGPPVYSLLVLAGIPSGHILVRRSLGARPPSPSERALLDMALAEARARGVPLPHEIFSVDEKGLNAAISGRTLFVYRDLYQSPYLAGVLAHELGHFNSMDGRLLLAIRALTVPGGFLIAYLLLSALSWLAYLTATLLIALLLVIFFFFRIRLDRATGAIFSSSVTLLRMLIIFAVGGVGPTLLGSLWRSYFVTREYAADAYAARLGYASDLIRFFENEVLNDVVIPWSTAPSHPPTTRRVAELHAAGRAHPQRSSRASAGAASTPRGLSSGLALVSGGGATARLAFPLGGWGWRGLLAGLLALALVVALSVTMLAGGRAGTAPRDALPTPGPTPTLGLRGGL